MKIEQEYSCGDHDIFRQVLRFADTWDSFDIETPSGRFTIKVSSDRQGIAVAAYHGLRTALAVKPVSANEVELEIV